LEWISSLAEIINGHNEIDWAVLIKQARNARAVKIVALGLHLAKHLGEVVIPENVFRELDPQNSMKKVAEVTLNSMFEFVDDEQLSLRAIRKNYQIMDRKRDVFTSALRAVFVPTLSDWQMITLPNYLHSLYYVLRPARLMKTYAESILRRLHMSASRRSQHLPATLPRT